MKFGYIDGYEIEFKEDDEEKIFLPRALAKSIFESLIHKIKENFMEQLKEVECDRCNKKLLPTIIRGKQVDIQNIEINHDDNHGMINMWTGHHTDEEDCELDKK